MREIKFRAWHNNEQMVYFCLGNSVPDGEIMQFTGLKDKNGKDIFEGDIVNDDLIGICQVKFNEKRAAFKVVHINNNTGKWFIDYLPSEFKHLEIIGNIHENSEIL